MNEEKKLSKWLPIFIVSAVLIVFLSIGGAFLLGKSLLSSQEVEGVKQELGPTYEVSEMIVNIANTNGTRYLRTKFTLEANNKKTIKELDKKLDMVLDKSNEILSSQTLADLDSIEGKKKIKRQLKDAFNKFLLKGEVVEIYLNKFVWE